jgi:hypothetical protein
LEALFQESSLLGYPKVWRFSPFTSLDPQFRVSTPKVWT